MPARARGEHGEVRAHPLGAVAQRVGLEAELRDGLADLLLAREPADDFDPLISNDEGQQLAVEARVFDERGVSSELGLERAHVERLDASERVAAALLELAHDFEGARLALAHGLVERAH
jgi:hypothetical protein